MSTIELFANVLRGATEAWRKPPSAANLHLMKFENGMGTFTGNIPAGIDAVDELILDVAREEGIASSQVFAMARVNWMIADRKAYPAHFPKKQAEVALLEGLVQRRPELFF